MREELTLLFRDLADLSSAERARYFEQNIVPADLRLEVESLLKFDTEMLPPFANSLADEAEDLLQSTDGERRGRRCGPYRLIQLLGRGGAGAVFLAERADGEVEHRVAIKLLRHDIGRPVFRDRFLQERQILASLQHPGIARLIDAGHTDDGQPYLVMDYIDGVSLDVYAAKLELRDKLTLFLRVCDAVSYAHRNLVVHRDIKPSNILVDAAGEPKLLDFGIARILDAATDQTRTQERLLTPDYASPEQVRGAAQTTTTDVYSLGAVLYEILAGQAPRSDRGDGRERSIPKPSETVTTPCEPAKGPGESVPRKVLRRALSGDLDNIVLKATNPEQSERYQSVDHLSEDLQRYLTGRPVLARDDRFAYRARKFLRRNRVAVAAGVLVLASLSGGLAFSIHEQNKTQKRFNEVRSLANSILFELYDEIAKLPGGTKARHMVLEKAILYLDGLAKDAAGDMSLRMELAQAYIRVAELQSNNFGDARN